MRLIDADALMNDAVIHWSATTNESCIPVDAVDEAPTIDAVPVVRCKDCKWWYKKDESPYGYCYASKHGHWSEHWEISIYRTYKGEWFCADGERKDDETD